jgi:hypothetical protein
MRDLISAMICACWVMTTGGKPRLVIAVILRTLLSGRHTPENVSEARMAARQAISRAAAPAPCSIARSLVDGDARVGRY